MLIISSMLTMEMAQVITSKAFPDSKVHVAHMGPTWVLSALGGPHVGPMNLVIRVSHKKTSVRLSYIAKLMAVGDLATLDIWIILVPASEESNTLGILQGEFMGTMFSGSEQNRTSGKSFAIYQNQRIASLLKI